MKGRRYFFNWSSLVCSGTLLTWTSMFLYWGRPGTRRSVCGLMVEFGYVVVCRDGGLVEGTGFPVEGTERKE